MCGRYTLSVKAGVVAKRFGLAVKPDDVRANYNVAPSQVMPVILESSDGKRYLNQMHWGIPRMLGKDLVKELINTRADKAFGGFWKRTVLGRRCLVPATGFYEWQAGKDGKTPFFIHPKDTEIFAFAGIWDVWKGLDGQEMQSYSIMTTEPNQEMKTIHTRMPVILRPEDEERWIDPSNNTSEGLESLLFPSADNSLEMYEVSRDVNSPKTNDEHLLLPV